MIKFKRPKPIYVKSDKKWQLDYRPTPPPIKDPRPGRTGWLTARPSCDTKEEAEQLAILVEIAVNNIDTNISTDERIDYIKAKQSLKDAGIETSILKIVEEHIEQAPKATTKTVAECYAEWREVQWERVRKGYIEEKTAKSSKRGKPALEPYFDKNISVFKKATIAEEHAELTRQIWRDFSPESLEKAFKTNKQFFAWCVGKRYLKEQPLTKELSLVEDHNRNEPPEVLLPQELRQLLHAAQRTDETLGFLAYFVIHCLVGVRPNEVKHLTWDNIKTDDPEDSFIYIKKTKTKKPRTIDLTKDAELPFDQGVIIEWLNICDRSKPIYPPNYAKRRKALLKEAGLIENDDESDRFQNIGRHSAATYMYKLGIPVGVVENRCGNSEDVLGKHYFNNNKTKKEAREYFSITPLKAVENVVKFA